MESVESIAAKIAHEDLVYLDYSPPVYQQVDRMALERAIAAALTAEREKFAAFADENGEPKSHCINCGTWWDRKERCPLCMGTHAEMVATEQAAEAAKEKIQ